MGAKKHVENLQRKCALQRHSTKESGDKKKKQN